MIEILTNIKEICDKHQITTLNRQIEVLENLQSQSKCIDIAVLGQFKAGKSSFINHFIGKNILPVDVIPVTSVITRLQPGQKEKATVTFWNGSKNEIDIKEIDVYVSETKNTENNKNVLYVDIKLPQLNQFKGLRFVDTPGIGSIFKHNTETTQNWSPEIGVALVAISAERPLSEQDILFIREVANYCPKVSILLTKTDLFTEYQVNTITEYLKTSLHKHFDKDFEIYPYTINHHAAYKQNLSKKLIYPLVSDFSKEFENIIRHKSKKLTSNCLSYLKIAYKTAQNDESERQNLKNQIFEEQLNKSFLSQELRLIATNHKSQTREQIFNILQNHENKLTNDLKIKFIQDYQSWDGNLFQVSRKYESWIKENLTNMFIEVLNVEYQAFVEISNSNKKHFQFFIKSFRDRLNSNIEKVLNIKMLNEDFEIEIKPLKKPDISVSWSFEIQLDLLWFLFPMFIFKKIFRRHFVNLIGDEVKKNIYRVTSDLNDLINKLINDYENQSSKYISSELTTIENILSQSQFESQYYLDLIKSLQADQPL